MTGMRKFWLRLLVTTIFIGIVALSLTGKGEQVTEEYVGEAFKRALITFALVRGINAVVSVVQGTEVAIEPAGVGVTLTPGEVLDPLNDLIERFSWVMLLATTSLGAQKILVVASGSWILQIALGLAAAIGVLLTWRARHLRSVGWRNFLLRFVILTLFVRFAIPTIALLNHITYEAFLAERFDSSYSSLEHTKAEVERAQISAVEQTADGNGVLDRFGRWVDRTSQQFDVDQRLSFYQDKLGEATEQVVDLIVVFVLTTIIFPLTFLFLGLRLLRLVGQVRWWKDE